MLRADVSDGQISELTVYCTGDWDEARQQEYARTALKGPRDDPVVG